MVLHNRLGNVLKQFPLNNHHPISQGMDNRNLMFYLSGSRLPGNIERRQINVI